MSGQVKRTCSECKSQPKILVNYKSLGSTPKLFDFNKGLGPGHSWLRIFDLVHLYWQVTRYRNRSELDELLFNNVRIEIVDEN